MNIEQFRKSFKSLDFENQKKTFKNMGTKKNFLSYIKERNVNVSSSVINSLENLYDELKIIIEK